jgi:hypothetical protein
MLFGPGPASVAAMVMAIRGRDARQQRCHIDAAVKFHGEFFSQRNGCSGLSWRIAAGTMSRGARFSLVGVHTAGSGLFAEVSGIDSIIYLVGLIVVVMFILSLLGLH